MPGTSSLQDCLTRYRRLPFFEKGEASHGVIAFFIPGGAGAAGASTPSTGAAGATTAGAGAAGATTPGGGASTPGAGAAGATGATTAGAIPAPPPPTG